MSSISNPTKKAPACAHHILPLRQAVLSGATRAAGVELHALVADRAMSKHGHHQRAARVRIHLQRPPLAPLRMSRTFQLLALIKLINSLALIRKIS